MRMRVGEITNDEIERSRSKKGGWTRKTLSKWGVPFPPPKGWRKAITKRDSGTSIPIGIPYDLYPDFQAVPYGEAVPVSYPHEQCQCGRPATRRASWLRFKWPMQGDPIVAFCDDCCPKDAVVRSSVAPDSMRLQVTSSTTERQRVQEPG